MWGRKAGPQPGLALVFFCVCWVGVCFAPSLAHARAEFRNVSQVVQSVADSRVTRLLQAAKKAYDRNGLSESYQYLEEAYRLRSDPEMLFLLGRLAYAERRGIEAHDLLRRYKLGAKEPSIEALSVVAKILNEPQPPAGELLFVAETDSLLLVDERIVGTLPLPAPLLLSAGPHQVVLELAGRRKQQDVDVQSGSTWLLRSKPDSDDLTLLAAPSVVLLPHHRGVEAEAQQTIEQAVEKAAQTSGHVLKTKTAALATAPQLAACLDSLLCQEDLGRHNQAEYVVLLHAEHSGVKEPSDWRLHVSLVDVAVGDHAANSTVRCTQCPAEKAAQQVGQMVSQLLATAEDRQRGQLQVRSTPSRAEVFAGDRKLGITPLSRPVWATRLALQVRYPGLPVYAGEVLIERDRTVSLSVDLGASDSAKDPAQKRAAKNNVHKKWWFWTAGGVLLGGVSLGLVLGLTPREHQTVSWVK